MINIFLLFVWFVYIAIIPGLAVLGILYQDLRKYEFIEMLVLSIGIGITTLIMISYLLNEFIIINLVTLTIVFLPFLCFSIFRFRKEILHLINTARNNFKRDTLKKAFDMKSNYSKFKPSMLLLILVLCFLMFIEIIDLLNNFVLGARDQWMWLYSGKIVAETGHFPIWRPYFESHPYGAALFLGVMFLPNLVNSYYIVLYIGTFLSLLQNMGVYIASKRVLNSDKFAIYSVLIYGTSRMVIWRSKMFTPEIIGILLIIVLTLFIFEKNLKALILGVFILTGIALTSLGSLAVIILPALLYIAIFKSRKISIIIIGIVCAGLLLFSSLLNRVVDLASRVPFSVDIWPLNIFFYNFAQWTFGYSLAFSFIGIIYCLLNRSSERLFYIFSFLELFILISFYPLRVPGRNYPFFSIFAATLTAQGLSGIVLFFKKYLPNSSKGWNIRINVIHLIIVFCIVYQVFFGMVRGYHATVHRQYQNNEISAILWLDDNSPKNATILAAPIVRSNPYRDILYPRTIIFNSDIYNQDSISDLIEFCLENHINYIIMRNVPIHQMIEINENYKEIYSNSLMVIFEHIPKS